MYPGVSRVFEENFNATQPLIINQGGTSSGKTYSILQVLGCRALQNPGSITTVVGQDIPNLKKGAMRDFQRIVNSSDYLNSQIADYNKTDRIYTLSNGSVVEFNSYSDFQDAKSGKRDFAFFNEANGISYEIYEEIQVRTTSQTYIDYNPTAPFWVHDKILSDPEKKYKFIKSTYKHNPFIEASVVRKIEGYKDTDPYRWQVYGLGEVGRLEGAVYENWEECQAIPPEATFLSYGLDFGFSNDPAALIEVWKYDKAIYIHELIYETGLLDQELVSRMNDLGVKKGVPIYCDSSEPKSIQYIRSQGYSAVATQKGADSIRAGIQLLKNFKIYVTRSSQNTIKEFGGYHYPKDRDGKLTNKPVDRFNHSLDALRYVALMRLVERKRTTYSR